MKIIAERYHDISVGHRVTGHESKCAHLHGHNYRFHFSIAADELDDLGRVLDFSVIKAKLCQWLEDHWDHRFLIWSRDPLAEKLLALDRDGVEVVPFNPTAENIAIFFIERVAPELLQSTGCRLVKLKIEETRKCSVIYESE